jgi:hypothetical protein
MEGKGFVNFRLNTKGKVDLMNVDGLTEFSRTPEPPATSAIPKP